MLATHSSKISVDKDQNKTIVYQVQEPENRETRENWSMCNTFFSRVVRLLAEIQPGKADFIAACPAWGGSLELTFDHKVQIRDFPQKW